VEHADTATDRLQATIALIDVTLVLDRAGVDPRAFSPAELRRLDRALLGWTRTGDRRLTP
jgi:hypothetical protein